MRKIIITNGGMEVYLNAYIGTFIRISIVAGHSHDEHMLIIGIFISLRFDDENTMLPKFIYKISVAIPTRRKFNLIFLKSARAVLLLDLLCFLPFHFGFFRLWLFLACDILSTPHRSQINSNSSNSDCCPYSFSISLSLSWTFTQFFL